MKQTKREKDIPDRLFLRRLLEAQGVQLEPLPKENRLVARLLRLFGKK
jgi:hypothetical protein